MQAAILAIGDELALGQTVDTNTAFLAARLVERGIMACLHITVADDRAAIADALRQVTDRFDLVLVTGGLGPTDDDLTRHALADVMGAPLVEDHAALTAIEQFFAARRRTMAERNRIQAMCPRGAAMIPNACGTAPGIAAVVGKAAVYIMPGVPSEMLAMWRQSIEPALADRAGKNQIIRAAILHTFGIGESDLAHRLDELMARDRNPLIGTTVAGGVVSVRIRSTFSTPDEASAHLERAAAQVCDRLGPLIFGRDDQTLAGVTVQSLKDHSASLAVAESCTGGLLAALVTDIPGSSAVFRGGWITYDNAMKRDHLGVPANLLDQYGAVSVPVAAAMARGALARSGATFAAAVTGIAGPEGASPDKPLGTVCVALARGAGVNAPSSIQAGTLRLGGDRATIRLRAACSVLQMLRLTLLRQPLTTLAWYEPADT